MMNQPIRLSRACCRRTELPLQLLASHSARGHATLLTDVSAQNYYDSFFFVFAFLKIYNGKKRAAAPPPTFIMQKCYCHYKRLFLCQKDVAEMFSIKGHYTVAANESIVDPPVFLNMFFFFPYIRDKSALT